MKWTVENRWVKGLHFSSANLHRESELTDVGWRCEAFVEDWVYYAEPILLWNVF
jgi:hypothetical protein